MSELNVERLEKLISGIKFDGYYLEATFQFKLLMQLASIIDENKILPERNIEAYKLKGLIKKKLIL